MTTKIDTSELYPSQMCKALDVLIEHPEAVLLMTSDEKTGKRFGMAKKRFGMAVKIGSGGRNKGQNGYQIWALGAMRFGILNGPPLHSP